MIPLTKHQILYCVGRLNSNSSSFGPRKWLILSATASAYYVLTRISSFTLVWKLEYGNQC